MYEEENKLYMLTLSQEKKNCLVTLNDLARGKY